MGIEAKISDSINSFYGVGGDLHNFFSKQIDSVIIGDSEIQCIKMDFGVIDPSGEVNGLLGLDLMIRLGLVINLKDLTIQFESE
ncbi:MAG: aspartyl protease [Firmicutes bacterium]|nr:aspartyl protease [Bacillota bacterium]